MEQVVKALNVAGIKFRQNSTTIGEVLHSLSKKNGTILPNNKRKSLVTI